VKFLFTTTNEWGKVIPPISMFKIFLPRELVVLPVIPQMVVWEGCNSNEKPNSFKVLMDTTLHDEPLSKKKYARRLFNVEGRRGGWLSSLGMHDVDIWRMGSITSDAN